MLHIGMYIADKTKENLIYCHNIGKVVAINPEYVLFKSCYDGLIYATPIKRYTIVDKFGIPI